MVIATPNRVHHAIALAAIGTGKHVLCEKPIAMTVAEAREMCDAAEAAGVVHMTAFTYRFVPAMRYLRHLVSSGALGDPVHFRAQRFQDWGRRDLAWRQLKSEAGTGELGDMLSHRLDYGHHLIGPFAKISALMHRVYDSRIDAAGASHPADVDDWVACIGTFRQGATACLESTQGRQPAAATAPPATISARSTAPAPAPAIASAIRTACRWAARAAASSASRCPRASWSSPARRAIRAPAIRCRSSATTRPGASSSRSSTARPSARRSAPGSRRRS